jgi:hypothetical protein
MDVDYLSKLLAKLKDEQQITISISTNIDRSEKLTAALNSLPEEFLDQLIPLLKATELDSIANELGLIEQASTANNPQDPDVDTAFNLLAKLHQLFIIYRSTAQYLQNQEDEDEPWGADSNINNFIQIVSSMDQDLLTLGRELMSHHHISSNEDEALNNFIQDATTAEVESNTSPSLALSTLTGNFKIDLAAVGTKFTAVYDAIQRLFEAEKDTVFTGKNVSWHPLLINYTGELYKLQDAFNAAQPKLDTWFATYKGRHDAHMAAMDAASIEQIRTLLLKSPCAHSFSAGEAEYVALKDMPKYLAQDIKNLQKNKPQSGERDELIQMYTEQKQAIEDLMKTLGDPRTSLQKVCDALVEFSLKMAAAALSAATLFVGLVVGVGVVALLALGESCRYLAIAAVGLTGIGAFLTATAANEAGYGVMELGRKAWRVSGDIANQYIKNANFETLLVNKVIKTGRSVPESDGSNIGNIISQLDSTFELVSGQESAQLASYLSLQEQLTAAISAAPSHSLSRALIASAGDAYHEMNKRITTLRTEIRTQLDKEHAQGLGESRKGIFVKTMDVMKSTINQLRGKGLDEGDAADSAKTTTTATSSTASPTSSFRSSLTSSNDSNASTPGSTPRTPR